MSELSFQPEDDYVQSANSLFHFMKEADYLKDALGRSALVPRYCVETVGYLGSQKRCFRNIIYIIKRSHNNAYHFITIFLRG